MTTRISGLSSGLDIDSWVKELMIAEREKKYNKMTQEKQLLEWRREDYKSINSELLTFHNDTLSDFKKDSTFKAKTVNISGNTTAVSATATANATMAPITIEVDKIAVAASRWSDSTMVASGSTFDSSDELINQKDNLVGGSTLDAQSTFTIKINGTEIDIDPDEDSLDDVIDRINEETNVSAFYDSETGKITFTAQNTGKVNGADGTGEYITFEDDNGFLANVLQINNPEESPPSSTNVTKGEDAQVTINGLDTTRSSNTFTVNGVKITLNETTDGEATTIQAKIDTDSIVESIKTFISEYNDLINTLNAAVDEVYDRDYPPLTDDQRDEMSDDEIENWEEKAKTGLLYNDSILTKLISRLRSAASGKYDTGNSKYDSLSSIGIKTSDYSEKGKLYLDDEDALREAIEADPEAVQKLFAASGDDDGNGEGIAKKMYDDVYSAMEDISEKAGTSKYADSDSFSSDSTMGKRISELKDDIEDEEDRLDDAEERYYDKFTAMETALNALSSQYNTLLSALGQSSS